MAKKSTPEERLLEKGRRVQLQALRREGKRAVKLGLIYPEISSLGWTHDRQGELEQKLFELNDRKYDQIEAQYQSKDATRLQEVAIDEFKPFKRRLVFHTRIADRRNLIPDDVDASAVFKSGILGRSPDRIYSFLIDNLPLFVRLDQPLAQFFPEEPVSHTAKRLADNIAQKDTEQEIALKSVPVQTRALWLLKGEVLELVEELLGSGQLHFEGDAPRRALFNKDRLYAARRGKTLPPDEIEQKDQEPQKSDVA